MNRNCYRLVFNRALGALVPTAECARGHANEGAQGGRTASILLTSLLAATPGWAELPVPSAGGANPAFVTAGQAAYTTSGNQALVNQVGNKAILNWQSFNVGAGKDVQFRQVDSLANNQLVQGANFTTLNRIWDINPSVIAGSLSQAAGQKANVIMVNNNGIAFMGGSQVNLNSFTASSLNIADKYVLDSLLNTDGVPQFENTNGLGGVVQVMENARITAGEQGRVMLIAPTVVNKGTVSAPGGQVVLAAGTKVFLRAASAYGDNDVRGLVVEVDNAADLNTYNSANTVAANGVLDGQTVQLTNASQDLRGHATNLGALTASTGNVTMVGYAVNQMGLARATTSVVANGSVYLMAKDRTAVPANVPDQALPGSRSQRAGRVVLGTGSVTEVAPESNDTTTSVDGSTGTGLAKTSVVQVLGQDVQLASGSLIEARSGRVGITALDTPAQTALDATNPFLQQGLGLVSNTARVHMAEGAVINVSGLENVAVSAARNTVAVELRGDELKDSPVNRNGALRGQTIYVDVERALARAEAGESTLVAQDSLEAYQARLQRTVDERSTAGGSVSVNSQGQAVFETGSVVNLSGGSVVYTAANVATSLLASNGKLTEASEASGQVRYDRLASSYTVDHGRWNVKETFETGSTTRYDPGYTQGQSAGQMAVVGMGGTVLQSTIEGRTVRGTLQQAATGGPAGASLQVGSNTADADFKNHQAVVLASNPNPLSTGFGFGDALSASYRNTLYLDPALLGRDKVANLTVYTNKAAAVNQAVVLPNQGGVSITAAQVDVNANITAPGGNIAINARSNLADGLTPVLPDTVDVRVANGVVLNTAGLWSNQRPGMDNAQRQGVVLDGGTVALTALNDVLLGSGVLLDVSAGAHLNAKGAFSGGDGGTVRLVANSGLDNLADHPGRVALFENSLRGFGFGDGGTLEVSSGRLQMGGPADNAANALNLPLDTVFASGFENITLTGRSGLNVGANTWLSPVLQNLVATAASRGAVSGNPMAAVAQTTTLPDQNRAAVNLTLRADSVASGDVQVANGAGVVLEPGATLTLQAGHRVAVEGTLQALGGRINVNLGGSTNEDFDPTSAIVVGAQGRLLAHGTTNTYRNGTGLVQGTVLDGGTVAFNASTGYVVLQEGSVVDVSGAAPVWLDTLNAHGGMGHWVGSGAGQVSVTAREGVVLDGTLRAQAGTTGLYGGGFNLTLGETAVAGGLGFPEAPSVIHLETTVPMLGAALGPGQAVPNGLNGIARVDTTRLQQAGFDTVRLDSADAITLGSGVNLGGQGNLRSVTLDAPVVNSAGGTAHITASQVALVNTDVQQQAGAALTPQAGTGQLVVNAQQVQLAGQQALNLQSTHINATTGVDLAGVVASGGSQAAGGLHTLGDVAFTAGVVAPGTLVDYTVSAPGATVSFAGTGQTPLQPLSAFGQLRVEAAHIEQGGHIWAPLGQIELVATGTTTLTAGSVTSVAADAGSVLPFGRVENGRIWTYTASGVRTEISDLPEKQVKVTGSQVHLAAGATVSVAGGGDAQAYEFTVGPGGSSDLLAQPNTYAIVPSGAWGMVSQNTQETLGLPTGTTLALKGVSGVPDGEYTLLPAHYALLPGALAVRLGASGNNWQPGTVYTRQDGVQVAAGRLSDSRAQAPTAAQWQGVEVYTQAQVKERSEFTLTPASTFFADSRFAPQDAGRFVATTTGTGANSLRLEGAVLTTAGSGGQGAAVDIAAPQLALAASNATAVGANDAVVLAPWLQSLNANSVFLGGERQRENDGSTTLNVLSTQVTIANNGNTPLRAGEVLVAATQTVQLEADSRIEAVSNPGQTATTYRATGNGALVMASGAHATFERTGSPDRSQGVLSAAANSLVSAPGAVVLDATQNTNYQGDLALGTNGVGGHLSVGASRIGFGAAPGGTPGLVYSQTELDGLGGLDSLTFTSYSTFDLYGGVQLGRLGADGLPEMDALQLRGAGLVGLDNAGQTAAIRARTVTLGNPAGVAYNPLGTPGTGNLLINGQTLVMGAGAKTVAGFNNVTAQVDEWVGQGTGQTTTTANWTVEAARVRGQGGANQQLTTTGDVNLVARTASQALVASNTLGDRWALEGASVTVGVPVSAASGRIDLKATTGDVQLASGAQLDVSGRTVTYVESTKATAAGQVTLTATLGDVVQSAGSLVNVSAAAGGDAGVLKVQATAGDWTAAVGTLSGNNPSNTNGSTGAGAQLVVDASQLDLGAVSAVVNPAGFTGRQDLRARTGNLVLASGNTLQAQQVQLSADSGHIELAGTVNASAPNGGQVALFAGQNLVLQAGGVVNASATTAGAAGGQVVLGSRDGSIDLQAGSAVEVSGGAGGTGGEVRLRARRTGAGAGTDVAVTQMAGAITGASAVELEAVKVYSGVNTLTATGSAAGTLSLATMNSDNTSFATNHTAITSRLGQSSTPGFAVLNGVEARSTGAMALGADWNLSSSRAGGQAGVLTLLAGGALNLNNNLSDGFNVATATNGANPATLLADKSWSYRLVAGADATAANPMAVGSTAADLSVAAAKLVRTGTGDIAMAASGDIELLATTSAVYTAGRLTTPVAGFVVPSGAQYSSQGGDVFLEAQGNINGVASAQLYSNWLYRQGALNTDGVTYRLQPAWWARFDKFQQGVATLGGGDVDLRAGGDVNNVSASAATQGYTTATSTNAAAAVRTGGGSVRVNAGNHVLGGQYYADLGDVRIDAGGSIKSGQTVGTGTAARPVHTILAIGDGQIEARAVGQVDIQAILNPHLVVQSTGAGGNIANAADTKWSLFSTYADTSSASLESLLGDVRLFNVTTTATADAAALSAAYRTPLNFAISAGKYSAALLGVMPPSLSMVAHSGDVSVENGVAVLAPGANAQLEMLAQRNVSLPASRIDMADTSPLPSAVLPGEIDDQFFTASDSKASVAHATVPVHLNDTTPVRIEAATGSVTGAANKLSLRSPKPVVVLAGQNVQNLGLEIQHVDASQVSRIEAGGDIVFATQENRSPNAYVAVGGPGRLEMTAGGDISLGTSAGVLSRGTLDNPYLTTGGASLQLAAGVGQVPVDHRAALDRLVGQLGTPGFDDTVLWFARWLTGNNNLGRDAALAAVQAVAAGSDEAVRTQVRQMFFTGLRETGRDSNNASSAFAGNFDRGYRTLELLFPGLSQGASQGGLDIFASRIKTEQGGDIEVVVPSGDVVVGLSNTPARLISTPTFGKDAGVLGVVTVGAGDVRMAVRGDVLVNQSRVLTAAGGDILIWSSEGDIDAGKGKKTASAVPPPVIKVDAQGNVTQELQAAASGSGIGALSSGGVTAGDVDLVAPKGTVNAGDAGIRAGNLNIAANLVVGADNISVSGTSTGTPVADTSAVTAASSGATSGGDDTSKTVAALSQAASEAAKAAQDAAAALRPQVVRVEVLGFGD